MLTIEQVDLQDKRHVRRFVDMPYRLYKNHPQWVPPLRMDVELMLNKQKHPVLRTLRRRLLCRRCAMAASWAALPRWKIARFNRYHQTQQAQFYLFECEDDQEAAHGALRASL